MELESNSDIRTTLREIFFTEAKELDAAGKKAICVYVPVPQQKTFQKVQVCCHNLTWWPHLHKCNGPTILYLLCFAILGGDAFHYRCSNEIQDCINLFVLYGTCGLASYMVLRLVAYTKLQLIIIICIHSW